MKRPVFAVLLGMLLINGCGGGMNGAVPVPPTLPDISGNYLFTFGAGANNGEVASLIVTVQQTQWMNDINMLNVQSGHLLAVCPGTGSGTITIAAHLEWNGTQEKFVLTINSATGQEILSMSDDNFVVPYSGAWEAGPGFPCSPAPPAPLSWTGVKQ